MLNVELVHDTGLFSYADAEHLADLWNRAYPAMRKIATAYIEGMRAAVDAILEGRLDPTPLYTDRFSLGELPKAFERMRQREGLFLKSLLIYD